VLIGNGEFIHLLEFLVLEGVETTLKRKDPCQVKNSSLSHTIFPWSPEWRYPVRWCISLVSINKCFHSNINFQCKITSISSLRLRKLIIPTAYVTSSLASDNLQAYVLQGTKKLHLIFDLKLPSQSNLITR